MLSCGVVVHYSAITLMCDINKKGDRIATAVTEESA